MLAGLFTFALLLVGSQAVGYGDVGACNNVTYDETYYYPNVNPLMYVHSITNLPGSDRIDGIVIRITKDTDDEEVLLASVDIHTKDGSVTTQSYKNIIITKGVVQELFVDEKGNTLTFYLVVVGQIPECGVLVYYRCSFSGTLSQDVTQVLKKNKAPLSDACEAKVAAIMKNKGVVLTTPYVLPYAAKNYS